MGSPNVLLLDEPTNDLDTQTLTVLEDYLETFSGVVITVSHDRYFLDKTCHQLLVFKNKGNIDFYYGNYSEFLEEKTEETVPQKTIEPQPNRTEKKKKKLTYAESKEWEEIEGKMEQVESRLKDITAEMSAAGSDFEKVRLLLEEEKELNEKLEYTMERWTYLAEKLKGNK